MKSQAGGSFRITYNNWNPQEQKLREALCTLANGFIGTRGAAEEKNQDDFNYPGTYILGGYNRAKTEISGRSIENEDLVNFPNWLFLSFRAEGGQWLDLDKFKIHYYQQRLEMKNGVLEREFQIEDAHGRQTSILSRRIMSMLGKHLAGIQWSFTPKNWSGKVEIKSALDGTVINDNVNRYSDLESNHLEPLGTEEINEDGILLMVQTRQSKITMAQAARTKIYCEGEVEKVSTVITQKRAYIDHTLSFSARKGKEYKIEKIVAIYTGRDRAISEPALEASKDILRAKRFKNLLLRHQQAYQRLWPSADIGVIGNKEVQKLVRLHVFHVLQTVSLNTIGMDVGVPARGIHGEAYRGHIFWDELYIFPFLNFRFPEITRSLLMYRYDRLDEARHAARKDGYKGAMFPWQSGSNGREESQVLHLNPDSGNWLPDNTHLQRHVNSTIAYSIWNYYLATEDRQFLSFFGAEIFLSIALFWASKAVYNKKRNRYEFHGVVGPDEYHTSYPDSEDQGLKNNAFTNVMAAWVLQKALEILELIEKSRRRELLKELEISNKECAKWKKISKQIFVLLIKDGIISQFEGYENLEEFPWEEYRKKYGNIQRLDRILEKEGNSINIKSVNRPMS